MKHKVVVTLLCVALYGVSMSGMYFYATLKEFKKNVDDEHELDRLTKKPGTFYYNGMKLIVEEDKRNAKN